jgi:hypothetical protein
MSDDLKIEDVENENYADLSVTIVNMFAGALPIPLAGTVAELFGKIIPNQKLDRAIKFLKQLDKRVENLESILEIGSKDPKFNDNLELTLEIVVKTESDSMREKLAEFTADNLKSERIDYLNTKNLLQIFRDLNEQDIQHLQYFHFLNLRLHIHDNGQDKYIRTKNIEELVIKPYIHNSANRHEIDQINEKMMMYDFRINKLMRYNLILPEIKESIEVSKKKGENDRFLDDSIEFDIYGAQKANKWHISILGKQLIQKFDLEEKELIDLIPSKENPFF